MRGSIRFRFAICICFLLSTALVSRSQNSASSTDPVLRALLEQKQVLEDQIAALKLRKAQTDPAEYDRALEKLVTELALKTRAIQRIEGKKP